ncbi:MAG TPA: TonB dependent receptor family protein, partial [Rhodanobacteraceae bacterium]|nr:TonB dependent receptor family protein [Rhodanobacteraceae bacterium]
GFAVCDDSAADKNRLGAVVYNDARITWRLPVQLQSSVSLGVNNVFDKDPPICLSCSLNGYDASTYDLPGRFWYVEANVKF